MEDAQHICFIDDDEYEIITFRRLYENPDFTVNCIHAQHAEDALLQTRRILKGKSPDLFVLDLYFPSSTDSPTGFDTLSPTEFDTVTQGVARTKEALKTLTATLEKYRSDGKKLLRDAHAVAHRARDVLDTWCKQLNQSASGGIDLIKLLNSEFPKVPKLFYSRKATLKDAKEALAEGAIDVLSKPDPSLETLQAAEISKQFLSYCNRNTPSFLAKWIDKVCIKLGVGPEWAKVEVSVEKSLK